MNKLDNDLQLNFNFYSLPTFLYIKNLFQFDAGR